MCQVPFRHWRESSKHNREVLCFVEHTVRCAWIGTGKRARGKVMCLLYYSCDQSAYTEWLEMTEIYPLTVQKVRSQHGCYRAEIMVLQRPYSIQIL